MKKTRPTGLLADANFCTLPLLSSLKQHDVKVYVCGNLLSDPCHLLADGSYDFDYSNRDTLLTTVKEGKFDYLIPGCNDQSYLSCSWVAEQCGLQGYDAYETVLILHHKDKFRDFALKNGYPTPRVAYSVKECKRLEYPLIVKPVDAFSGRGTRKITENGNLAEAVADASNYSNSGRVLIEEFKSGALLSHSAFIRNNQIVQDFFVDEFCTVYPYQVNSSCISSGLNPKLRLQIRECMTQMVKDLDLVDGLLHTQILVDDEKFWLVEVTRRCPGDLYSRLIELSTGFNYPEAYILPFLGKDLNCYSNKDDVSYYARHTISSDESKNVFSVSHALDVKNTEIIQLRTCGQIIEQAPFGKSGIVFVEFKSEHEMKQKTPNLKQYIKINSFDNLSTGSRLHV